MARPYSQDLRRRMARAALPGRSRHEVARTFDVGASRVIKRMRRVAATGGCRPRKLASRKDLALADREDRAFVAEKPGLTITGLWVKVVRFLIHLGPTFKKNLHAAEQEHPDDKAALDAWPPHSLWRQSPGNCSPGPPPVIAFWSLPE